MMIERTFIMIKPDGIQRGLIGEIIARFERRGMKIVGMKFVYPSKEMAEKQYEIHRGKSFYEGLIDYITSGPILAIILEGEAIIEQVRKMVGETDPKRASPGTIRGDYAQQIGRNIIHASDSKETAEFEIKLWFDRDEIVDYEKIEEKWLFEPQERER
jgi:nucleoside-diphosphate kinase